MSYIPVPGLFRARMASTANLTLSAAQTIDTIVGVAGNVVLVKNQSTASQNGLYVMAAGAWARLPAADNAAELVPGSLVVVSEGSANVAGSVFELTTAAPLVVGTTNLTFALVAAPGATGVALSVTNPADVGTVAAVGVGTTAARADHVHDFNATDTATVTWDFTTPGVIKANAAGGGGGPSPASDVTDVIETGPSVVGVGVAYARDDHAHFHGELIGGALHEVVNFDESGDPGFMSMEDKSKLDNIEDNATASFPSNADPLEISDATADPGDDPEFSRANHVHPHGERGAGTIADPLHTVATNEAPGFMAAADHSALALWDVTKCRYFFLDNSAGDDAHVGFLDRAPGHAFGGGEAAAVVAAKIKTVERLLQILPRNGNGRMCKILFKNRSGGSTYRMADGTTFADLDLTGIHGYRWIGRCGSTDLSNTTNDMTQAGGIVSRAGPNVDESFTVATISGGVITIPSGSFGTDADQAGLRLRFKGNVTPDAENFCYSLYRVNSTTSLRYVGSALTPTPVAGDEFFIERVGVTFANVYDISSATTMIAGIEDPDLGPLNVEMISPMVGIQAQADDDGGAGVFRFGCVGKTAYCFTYARYGGGAQIGQALSNGDTGHVVFANDYRDEIGQLWASGPCNLDNAVDFKAQAIEVKAGGLCVRTDVSDRSVAIRAGTLSVASGCQFRYGALLELEGAGFNQIGDGNQTVPVRFGVGTNLGAGFLVRTGSGSMAFDGMIIDSTESSTDYGFSIQGGPSVDRAMLGPNVSFKRIVDHGDGLVIKGVRVVDCYHGRFIIDDSNFGDDGLGATGFDVWGTGDQITTMPFDNLARNSLIDERGNSILGPGGPQGLRFKLVRNTSGATIDEGSFVAIQNASNPPQVYITNGATTAPQPWIGMSLREMVDDAYGYVAIAGTPWSKDLQGDGATGGEIVYASDDVDGAVTIISPSAGAGRYKWRVGCVVDPVGHFDLRIDLVEAGLADGNP
jgi:hypothetical protein